MKFYIKLLKIFSKELHLKFAYILFLQFINALLEIFSFTLILPSLQVFIDPKFLININNFLYNYLDLIILKNITYQNFLLLISVMIIIIYFLKSIISISINIQIFKFIKELKIFLSSKFLSSNLKNNHFEASSSSATIRTALGDVSQVCESVVTSFLNTITDIILLLFILVFIFFVQPAGSIISFFIFLMAIFSYSKIVTKPMKIMTSIYHQQQAKLIESIQNIHRNIREIKIFGKELFFLKLFNSHLIKSEDVTVKYKIMHSLPKIVYEFFGIIAIMAFFLVSFKSNLNSTAVMAEMGVVAICAFRIIPSASRISGNISAMKFAKASVDILYNNFILIKNDFNSSLEIRNKIIFSKLEFSNVSFSYKNPFKQVFQNINIEIQKGDKIGIVGKSGVGKSTLIELICGLMIADSGKILIHDDHNNLCKTDFKYFAYVSQNVLLLDDTIKNNIAFGIEENLIDIKKIEEVCQIADLNNFLCDLDKKLDTKIGELGSKLSGGQKQRISIARALYFDREIVIFDEATSALDMVSEKNIINNLRLFYPQKTLIIVSHRESILSICNKILDIENLQITAGN